MQMNPLPGMALVACSFAVIMGGVTAARRALSLQPELSRKLVHVGMGLVTLSFPLLFLEAWPVWVLSISFLIALAALRFVTPLRQRLGKTLSDVGRQSLGEFYFPLAVARRRG